MKKALIIGLILIIIGLVVGYLIFGKINGKYIPLQNLLGLKSSIGQDFLKNFGIDLDKYKGFDKIRLYIILCGAGGLVGGILLALIFKKRR